MSVLDRFRRNRQQSVLPDEVRQYYQTEQRQRRGVAIGLAIVALLITIAIAAALFFGGRFVYDQIWGDDSDDTSQKAPEDENANDTKKEEGTDKSNNSGQQSGQQNQGGSQGSVNAPTTPAPQPSAPAPAPTPTTTPSTPNLGDETLPHTGDEGM